MARKRRKSLQDCDLLIEDGFSGTGEIDDAALAASDTTLILNVAENELHDSATIVPVTARFTTAGIDTIRTVTGVNNNKVWTLTVDATSGNYTVTFNGVTSASIAEGATAAAVQTAFENLANVEVGDILVTGSTGGPYTVEAKGQFAGLSTPTLSALTVDLAGGGATVGAVVLYPGNATWELTFTPAFALGFVPADEDVVTFLPCQVSARMGDGDISWTITRNLENDLDRGKLDGRREGDEEPMAVDLTFVYDYLRTASPATTVTPYEALMQEGVAAGWHSAGEDPCSPYCVNIIVLDTPKCGSDQKEKLTIRGFAHTEIAGSIADAELSVSGESEYTKPLVERIA